jgi:hypothetical protein
MQPQEVEHTKESQHDMMIEEMMARPEELIKKTFGR